MFIIISVLLTGCGGKQKEIPYPDGYYVPKPEETETAGKSDKSQKNASETAKETTRETIQARAGSEPPTLVREPPLICEIPRFKTLRRVFTWIRQEACSVHRKW